MLKQAPTKPVRETRRMTKLRIGGSLEGELPGGGAVGEPEGAADDGDGEEGEEV